jgi:hypothetical protein
MESILLTQPDAPARPLVLNVLHQANQSNQRFEIADQRCLLGGGSRSHIRIENADSSSCLCEFVRLPAGVYVRQISATIRVNGVEMPEAWVREGDRIQVANREVQVLDPGQFRLPETVTGQPAAVPPAARPAPESATVVAGVLNAGQASAGHANSGYDSPECTAAIAAEDSADTEPHPQPANVSPAAAQSSSPPAAIDGGDFEEFPSNSTVSEPTASAALTDSQQARWLEELYQNAVHEARAVAADMPVTRKPATDESGESWMIASVSEALTPDPSVPPQALPPTAETPGVVPPTTDPPSRQVTDPITGRDEPVAGTDQVAEELADDQLDDISRFLQQMQQQQTAIGQPVAAEPQVTAQPAQPEVADHPVMTEQPVMAEPSVAEVEPPLAAGSDTEDQFAMEQQVPSETEAAAEPIEEPKIESVADVLRRMQEAGSLSAAIPTLEELEESERSDFAEHPGSAAANEPATTIPGDESGEDAGKSPDSEDSVQDYMNQLMHRLRGSQPTPAAAPLAAPSAAAPADSAPPSRPRSISDGHGEHDDLTPSNPMLPDEFKPGYRAPENTNTLDALRMVANQSVEQAIQRRAREKSSQTSLIYLGGSGICLCLSAVMYMLSDGVTDWAFTLAVAFAIGCVACAFMYLSISIARDRLLRRKLAGKNKAGSPKEAKRGRATKRGK